MVFNARCDDVVARANQSGNRKVVRLGTAAGENDFGSAAAKQCGHRLASVLNGGPCVLAVMVDRRGVAELLPEIGPHRLEYLGQNGRGGVIVEINAMHAKLLFYSTLWQS